MIHCRFIEPADRVKIINLARQHQQESAPHLTFDLGRMHTTVDRALARRNLTIFVAEEDDAVFGYLAAVKEGYAACAGFYVEQQLFYVCPDQRGSRAAAKLFTGFVRWAELQRAEEIFANIWDRKGGARWLRRFGFEPAGLQMRRRAGGK